MSKSVTMEASSGQPQSRRSSWQPSLLIVALCCTFAYILPTSLSLEPNPFIYYQDSYHRKQEEHLRKSKVFLSPMDFQLAEHIPVKHPSEDDLQAMQMPNLFEGDIVTPGLDLEFYHDIPEDLFRYPLNSALNIDTYPDKLWTDGKVPYELEPTLKDSERVAVAQAFEEYRQKTCVRFVPRAKNDFDYIYIQRNEGKGCSSYVGKAGGNQSVSLEIEKCFSKGVVAHELMHVLGFFHEHSRPDRDKFVMIIEDNIKPGMLRNFEKYPTKIIDTMAMPYDYDSVMHYHKLAFSSNGQPTIQPIDSDAQIGQRYRLSKIDADKVNKLYNCDELIKKGKGGSSTEKYSTPTTATSGGYSTNATLSSTSTTLLSTLTSFSSTTSTTFLATSTPYYSIASTSSSLVPVASTTTSEIVSTSTDTPLLLTATSAASATTTDAYPVSKPKKCEDLNDHCEMWAEIGHCNWSEKYMSYYCRKSCRICSNSTSTEYPEIDRPDSGVKKCTDKNLFCGYWARIGECQTESKFMKMFCEKSCGICN